MSILSNIPFPELARQVYQYIRQRVLKTPDVFCLREGGKTHVEPAAEASFAEHTSFIPYTVALKTRAPIVHDVLKYYASSTILSTRSGCRIRVVDRSELLNTASKDVAAIVREDESLVVWSSTPGAIDQKYEIINYELSQIVDRHNQQKTEAEYHSRLDELLKLGAFVEYPEQYSPEIPPWQYTPPSRRSVQPELPPDSAVFVENALMIAGNTSADNCSWPLDAEAAPPLYHGGSDRELTPSSSSSSSWATPYYPTATLPSVSPYQGRTTVHLTDVSPLPPPPDSTHDETPLLLLHDYVPTCLDSDDIYADEVRGSSPLMSPYIPASTSSSSTSALDAAFAGDGSSRYHALMGDLVPTAAPSPSYRSRLRSSSIMLATSAVLPSISRSSRERQARVDVPKRPTPYPRTKRNANLVEAAAASRKASPRTADASPPQDSASRKRTREDDDDYSDLTDLGDSDEEYRDRPAPKRVKRVHCKAKHLRQEKVFCGRKRRRTTKSYDLAPKPARKFPCGNEGCDSKCTRIGDTSRHMVFSCPYRENKDFKPSDSLCLYCGVHQARADALKRHIRDRHRFPEGRFPDGYIEERIASGEIEDYMSEYENIHKDSSVELHRVAELLNRKYRLFGTPSQDEGSIKLVQPAVAVCGLPESNASDSEDSMDDEDDEYDD